MNGDNNTNTTPTRTEAVNVFPGSDVLHVGIIYTVTERSIIGAFPKVRVMLKMVSEAGREITLAKKPERELDVVYLALAPEAVI